MMSHLEFEFNQGEFSYEGIEVDHLSVEYLVERRWEASPVVFNIKSRVDYHDDFDFDAWSRKNGPTYMVHRLYMEPVRGGHTGRLRIHRVFPDVVGYYPNDPHEATEEEPADVPNFALAPDSLAEFYLSLKGPYAKGKRLSLQRSDTFDNRSFLSLISGLEAFNFHQPDTRKPYKFYDSRDFICQVFARLLSEGFVRDATVISDKPYGARKKIETEQQKNPYAKASSDSRADFSPTMNFSTIIGNLFFSDSDLRRDLDQDWGRHVQALYQPIIRGQFKKHDRLITLNYSKPKKDEKDPRKEIRVPEEVTFPYNRDESQIDRERSDGARRIYQSLNLKTTFYWEPLDAETTKTHEHSTKGLQKSTQPCQHCGSVSTKPQTATATSARTVPTTRDARAPGTRSGVQSLVATPFSRDAYTAASPPQPKSYSAVKQPSSRPVPSVTGKTREKGNVPMLSTPVATAKPMHATASNARSRLAADSTSGRAISASPSTRTSSSQAGSSNPLSVGDSTAREGGDQRTSNISKKRTAVSGPETKKSVCSR